MWACDPNGGNKMVEEWGCPLSLGLEELNAGLPIPSWELGLGLWAKAQSSPPLESGGHCVRLV